MFSVIFEVHPKPDQWDAYLANAKLLRPELERVDGCIHEGNPFAAGGRELRKKGAILGCHDGPRADFAQRRGHVKGATGDRLLAQPRHDLQDRRARQSSAQPFRNRLLDAHKV